MIPETFIRREGRSGAGLSTPAFDRSDQSSLFSADESACAHADFHIKGKTSAEDVFTQQSQGTGLLDANIEHFDCDGILRAAVDIAISRADRKRADDHTFDHGMGVAFQNTAVHERARVAFIGIAGNEFHRVGFRLDHAPFFGGGESSSAPASKPRFGYFIDNSIRGHFREDFGQRHVTIFSDIVLDVFRVDLAAVS